MEPERSNLSLITQIVGVRNEVKNQVSNSSPYTKTSDQRSTRQQTWSPKSAYHENLEIKISICTLRDFVKSRHIIRHLCISILQRKITNRMERESGREIIRSWFT